MYEPKVCVICGKEFSPTTGNAKVCSSECRAELLRRKSKAQYERKRQTQRLWRERKKAEKAIKRRPPIQCEGYAERQKAETIEMFARIKL